MDLEKLTTEQLIESIPENRPIYKDSGLWTVYNDVFDTPIIRQSCNESLKQFLIRYIEFLRGVEYRYSEELEVNLLVANQLYTSDELKIESKAISVSCKLLKQWVNFTEGKQMSAPIELTEQFISEFKQ